MKKLLVHIILLAIISIAVLKGQDAQFSQFYSNPLYLAPSFAGAVDGSRISANYRKQWWDLGIPFNAYSFSYDHFFSTFNSGIGIYFMSDVVGTSQLGSKQVSLMYSYDIKMYNIYHIRPGISFTALQHGFNGNLYFINEVIRKAEDGDGIPHAVQARDFTRDIDAGASILFYTYDLWFGATVDHLLQPNISLYSGKATIGLKKQFYGGWTFRKRGKLLKPSDETMTVAFLYREQESIKQLDLGVYWHNYPLVLGIWYRGLPPINSDRGDAMVFLAGLKTRNFNIGYSYDFTISNLLPYTMGSHEISLTYKFLLPEKTKKGQVPCPEF